MKAIFELAAPATRLDRAETAGDAVCDWALRPKTAKSATPDERDEGHDCRLSASSTPLPLSGLLDQRFDECVELCMRDGIAGRGGRVRV